MNTLHLLKHPLTSRPLLDTPKQAALMTLPALFIAKGTENLALTKCSMSNALHRTGQNLPKPKAIIIMSANWTSSQLEISSTQSPMTWHDFAHTSGTNQSPKISLHTSINKEILDKAVDKKIIDKKLYDLDYPAHGHAELAESLASQLQEKNIPCCLNPIRAYDSAVWIPLLHLYPQADIPIVQISIPKNFSSYNYYQLGAIFSQLRQEQVLLIGSGVLAYKDSVVVVDKTDCDTLEQKSFPFFKTWLLQQLKCDIPKALDWQTYSLQFNDIQPELMCLEPLFFVLGAGQRVSVVHDSMMKTNGDKPTTEVTETTVIMDSTETAHMMILRFD